MIKVNILDQDWKLYVLDEDEFTEKFDESDAAVTLPDTRECYFCEGEVTRVNVRHELFHMYASSLNLSTASLTVDQYEEVLAETYGQHADRMLRLSRFLFKELKKEEASV